MDRRKQPRIGMEFSVRVWGVDRVSRPFAELVRARRVSEKGAELIGMRSKLSPGALIDVQHGAMRAQFRIVWTRVSGEAGIQALAFEPPIWGIGFPPVYERSEEHTSNSSH